MEGLLFFIMGLMIGISIMMFHIKWKKVKAANFLKQQIPSEVVVSRIGGDEFAILFVNISNEELVERMNQLQLALAKYNEKCSEPLKISLGKSHMNSSLHNIEKLYTEAAAKMYEQKNVHHIKNM